MLRARRRTQLVAAASIFAALYAVLGTVPISRLVGIGAFITFRETVSPVAGMVLGPLTGGFSIFIGVLLDFALGKPVVFLGLDFLIDASAAVTAGLAFTGRRKLAIIFPATVIGAFMVGPSSPLSYSYYGVPFAWMHFASVGVLAAVLFLEHRGTLKRLSWVFVAGTMFASTMCGHAMGGLLTEFVYLGSGNFFGHASAAAYWQVIFFAYPLERVFLTVVGTLIGFPVLRGLSRRQESLTTS